MDPRAGGHVGDAQALVALLVRQLGVAERITCPTLVYKAEEDFFFGGQPELLYEHLTAPRTLLRFTADEGTGAHCHSGARRLAFGRIYDWLDEVLAAA